MPGYEERHSVRPGLTGIAQIYAPRDIKRRNKFRYDRIYIRQPSFWLDVRLIALYHNDLFSRRLHSFQASGCGEKPAGVHGLQPNGGCQAPPGHDACSQLKPIEYYKNNS